MVRASWIVLLVAAISSPALSSQDLGTPVTIQEHPSVVQVEVGVLGTWVQQCAGAVITNYHILSNAYCFSGSYYDRTNRRIRAGATNRYENGQVVYVLIEYNYPDFGILGKDGDLSVVRLQSNLKLGSDIQQTLILGQGIYLPSYLTVTALGWGSTIQGGESSNNQLHRLDLVTHNYEKCMEHFQVLEEPEIITENMICVGRQYDTGRDFDGRDIGAPLFYENTLVGLLSFGKSQANDKHPAVATNIGSYSNWIVSVAID
ncbi:trypsin, alkaline A-like [Manduca sexta]|uniref:Peptidase S1 domain-containing protein n=1 Tax=Manduca sexta TaxID=7130 RepID=A0A921YUC4_MANSE|nr:trypsin, alkaline A-like [Manduca sexta]KAG6446130.1 hypothetical protein O3G_MSEX004292 [Manduca sexta]KAG6446131.1 hypothetical protein O3G_MSEX004292 [Manduca sexta]